MTIKELLNSGIINDEAINITSDEIGGCLHFNGTYKILFLAQQAN